MVVEIDPQQENPARLLFMTPERTAASVGQFVAAMPAHGANPEQVRLAAIDMSAAYQKGVKEHLTQAQIVFDHFHVMQLAGQALDEVRKQSWPTTPTASPQQPSSPSTASSKLPAVGPEASAISKASKLSAIG